MDLERNSEEMEVEAEVVSTRAVTFSEEGVSFNQCLIHLQTHSIVDLIISQGDMILIRCIPFLQLDLGCVRAGLSSDEFLEVTDRIVGAAFYSDLSPETVISNHFNQWHGWKEIEPVGDCERALHG